MIALNLLEKVDESCSCNFIVNSMVTLDKHVATCGTKKKLSKCINMRSSLEDLVQANLMVKTHF